MGETAIRQPHVFCSTPAVGVVRNIGRKHAMEMLLTGEPIDAATALSWGLINRVVPGTGWTPKLGDSPILFCPGVLPRSASANKRSTARSIILWGQLTTSPAKRWRTICFWKMPQKGLTHFFRSDRPSGAESDVRQPKEKPLTLGKTL
jgi:hypothetical protein